MVDFIIMSHSTRKPSMFDKITAFFQQNKFVVQSALLVLIVLFSSVFFYKFNSIAVGYSSKLILALGVISSCVIVALAIVQKKMQGKTEKKTTVIYLASLIIMGTLYSAVFLPGSIPDETHHYNSAYSYTDLILGRSSEPSSLEMRETDVFFSNDVLHDKMNKENYHKAIEGLLEHDSSNTIINYTIGTSTDSIGNPPQTRLAASLGLLFGQLLGLNGTITFYLGRLFNFLLFCILSFLAFRITPVAKLLFASITLLPMTLHVAASFSYDATIIGLSLLLTAMCLKGIYSKEKLSSKFLTSLLIVVFLLAPCKLIYTALAFLVFLIPNSNFKTAKVAHIYKALFLAVALLAIIILRIPSVIESAGIASSSETAVSTLNRRGSEYGYFYTLSDLTNSPLHTLFILVNTILTCLDSYIMTFVGGSLGWFQPEIKTPWHFFLLFFIVLLYAVRQTDSDSIIPSKKVKVVLFFISLLIGFGAVLSMFIGHTFNYELNVQGVQGRYFLPFAPLLFLLFRTKNTQRKEESSPAILLALFALNAMNLIYIWAATARI